jgi:hypothetical protein
LSLAAASQGSQRPSRSLARTRRRVPGDARQLQARWDSVINARVALQTLALAALCVALAAA